MSLIKSWISVLFILLCFESPAASEVCPPPEDISPCICLSGGNLLYGHCAGISSLDQLENSIKGFYGAKLTTFSISQSKFDYLPYNIFENMTIQFFTLSKSNISRIGNLLEPQFKGLETSLESVAITETFTREHPFTYIFMDYLKKLKKIELRKNHVEVLHNEWFRNGLPALEVIRFVECHIRRVGYKALKELKYLKIVDLSDNAINYIPRTAFPQPGIYLEDINLERNELESLPEDFFSDMPNLKTVNLELNEFSTIDQKLWGSVWSHLQNFNIDYNPLICDAKIKWMFETKENLERKVVGLCYKPFTLFEREIHSLKIEELK